MQPIARCGPITFHCRLARIDAFSRTFAKRLSRPNEYHQGTPFCAVTTAVSCPSSGFICSAASQA